ncbi:MAG: hypothetical protein R2788_13915 [Saprospiraceae bacterium]
MLSDLPSTPTPDRRPIFAAWSLSWVYLPDMRSLYKADRVFVDMDRLLGAFTDKNKELQRLAVIERLYGHAVKIEKAAKMVGLDKLENGLDPSEFEFPDIEVTSDPRVLTLDVEHEEVE